jgi:hypothetical protein
MKANDARLVVRDNTGKTLIPLLEELEGVCGLPHVPFEFSNITNQYILMAEKLGNTGVQRKTSQTYLGGGGRRIMNLRPDRQK